MQQKCIFYGEVEKSKERTENGERQWETALD